MSSPTFASEESLVDRDLRKFIARDGFESTLTLDEYVQPASIDIPVAGECYLVKEKVLPFNKRVRVLLPSMTLARMSVDDKNGVVLLKGQTYLMYCGKLTMEDGMRGSLSPKSSIGRVDLMVRGIFDGCGLYDTIPTRSTGELWMEVSPRSFNIRVRKGQALSQLMIFRNKVLNVPGPAADSNPVSTSPPSKAPKYVVSSHGAEGYQLSFDQAGNPLEPQTHRGSMVFSLSVPHMCTSCATRRRKDTVGSPRSQTGDEVIGYEALPTSEVVDLSKIAGHPSNLFFRQLSVEHPHQELHGNTDAEECTCDSTSGKITLEKDKFYILATKERIAVPLRLSAEMVPFSQHVGELRAHYAGFFDPGFGFGKRGEVCGTVGVLEVRPHETITVYDGQPICLMEYYTNTTEPEVPYGQAGNNYHQQNGPKLAKYFC